MSKKLLNEGTVCRNANYNYLLTQSAPGYATIVTGTTPSHHGIVSNEWYQRLKEVMLYCTNDDKVKTSGGNSKDGQMSPKHLIASSFSDELKIFNKNRSKVIGISLKDYAAILPVGHLADAAYWMENESGNWISSSYYMDSLPDWVKKINNMRLPDIYVSREWNTMFPIQDYSESLSDENGYESGLKENSKTFPYILNELKNPDDYSILRYTPFGNTYAKDLAIAAVDNEKLGKDAYTDFLSISFSSNGYVSDIYGPRSVEIEDIYLRLDLDIAHFLDFINDNIGKENVLVFLTSDRGAIDIPEYLEDINMPGGYFNSRSAIAVLKSYLKAIYGRGDWVKAYFDQQLYLNQTLKEDSKLPLGEFQQRAAQFLVQFTGIANAITATTFQTTNFTDGILEKSQNSYNPERSGDVIINYSPGWVEQYGKKLNPQVSNFSSAYRYSTHVPLIWYGWKIKRISINRLVSISDIAPTLASMLNISFPNACTGEPILEILN
jgi:predicted AlkP superfamily pyrophosphatase or phosphodiesterase